MSMIYNFNVVDINGNEVSLSQYKGKVLLVVNTASNCGFTPQYEELEALYRDLASKGLVVLGFPCNQFGKQEPGDDKQVQEFCELNFGVSFPMFSKVEVNGENSSPLYQYLKKQAPGVLGTKTIKWNFTKFLVDSKGQVIGRFAPNVSPLKLKNNISQLF